ncbi:alpha/beta hydrolase [Rhodococcus qingshengii]|uniref:Alpha/beta hydrolase n=1 Tax=Rhodococcus qingshengii TaxID=334542 RepID=A0AAW6M005_RHOSG|nr:alpha/beta hydrolase [Rhodococcus qingshengii]MDE8649913.1 alpha/beta hydrolase [Rhodococcus qingshengii]
MNTELRELRSSQISKSPDSPGRFSGPVRIITGSKDPIDPAAVAQLESLPNIKLISLPGAGHHPQLTHTDALVDLLEGSLA